MNPFNLDREVARWRKQMAAQGMKSPSVLDELENHLREDVANQVLSGMNAAEAFRVAVQRIGQGATLKQEFAKLKANKPTLLPRLFRVSCFVTGPFMLLVYGWTFFDGDGTSFGHVAGFLVISGLAIYTGTFPFWYRSLPNPYRKWTGASLKAATILVGSLPVLLLLGALNIKPFQVNEMVTVILFALIAAFSATMLAYGCLDLERGAGWGFFVCPSLDAFTDLAQRAVEIAHEEAGRLGHDYVGTEHLLLGVVSCESGLLIDALHRWHMDGDTIRMKVEKSIGAGPGRKSARDLPYTPRTRRALALAAKEAKNFGHCFIAPEHLFVGLLLEKEGVAGRVLRRLGIDADLARREILDRMGPDGDEGAKPVLA